MSDPRVCPFLRVVDGGEGLGPPIEAPDPANRCAALHEPVPQSLRQQELVCLSSGHVNCPRYLRGALEVEPAKPVRTPRAAPSVNVTPATAGALAIFLAAFLLSLGFVLANGGVVLTAVAPTPALSGGVLGAIETAPPTPAPTPVPTPEPTPAPTATPATDAGRPTPEPTTTPLPSATPRPSRRAAADRPHRRPSRPPAAMRC